jgi:hypothetical protein
MKCAKCNVENPADKKFCGDCGAPLAVQDTAVAVPGDEGAYYCARHKKEVTRVRCGRCEIPICPRCTVYGPAGVRCRECARNRVPLRPMGVVHEATRGLNGVQGVGRVVWYAAIWSFFVSIFSGLFGGHNDS